MNVNAYNFLTLRRVFGWDMEFFRVNWSYVASSPMVDVTTPARVEANDYEWVSKSLKWFGRFE